MRSRAMTFIAMQLLLLLLLGGSAPSSCQSSVGVDPVDSTECDVAVVGGGPSGVYAAYRLLETNASMEVCLFEATSRLGGRVYSVRGLGPKGDLVLDMGAYRYMPLVQPLVTSVIENLLNLPNRLYQPAVPDYKIVLTPDGSNAGYATWITDLASKAEDMGLRLNYESKVVKLFHMPDGSFTLQTSTGRNITATDVVLNLPTRPLHRLLQASGLPQAGMNDALLDVYQVRATKLYLYYDHAWWIANGLNNGSLAYNLPWNTTQPPVVPIIGRYYDAQVKCPTMASSGSVMSSSISQPDFVDYYWAQANSLNTQNCYGYIQATYTSDGGTTNISHYPLDYLADYASPTPGSDGFALPYSVWDNSTTMGYKLLNDSHTQLMAYSQSVGQNLQNADALPTQAVVAFWDASVDWSGGAWHSNKTTWAGTWQWSAQVLKPFNDLNLYVANEAFGTQEGWAESGMMMAEAIVSEFFGASRPDWMSPQDKMDAAYAPGFDDYETAQQGGGTGQVMSPANGIFTANSGLAPTPAKY